MRLGRVVVSVGVVLACACGTAASPSTGDGGADGGVSVDAGPLVDAAAPEASADAGGDTGPPPPPPVDASPDAPVPPPTPCPAGVIVASGATCVTVTPEETGAAATGENATFPHYALAPQAGASGFLVLSLNGSGGHPAGVAKNPARNVYTAALAEGHHALGLSYRSNVTIGGLCGDTDACYLASRTTVLTGVFQVGADETLRGVLPSEGVYARLALALQHLARADPGGGWGAFLQPGATPEATVRWGQVIVSGHSQGGGHATLLGKLHAVRRIVALASPCDTAAAGPASWLVRDGSWATDPALAAFGFAAESDPLCPAHAAIWDAMAIDPARRFDDAVVCASDSAHGAPIGCTENFPRLRSLFHL